MSKFIVHTEETEHSGDLERYASAIRCSNVRVLNSRYPLMGEYETGEMLVETTLTARELQDHINRQEDAQGFCFVSRVASESGASW